MKILIFIITTYLFSSLAFCSPELTLLSPVNGELNRNVINSKIVWAENYSILESWRLTCKLKLDLMGSGGLLYSYGVYNYGDSFLDSYKRDSGLVLGINEEQKFYVSLNKEMTVIDDLTLSMYSGQYNLSVDFISIYTPVDDIIIGGNVIVAIDDYSVTYQIEDVNMLKYCYLTNEKLNPNSVYPVLYTNYFCNYSDISLEKLETRIVPEPSSFTLIIASLISFCFFRRRR